MALFRLLLIFCPPSRPRIIGAWLRSGCGSGNTGFLPAEPLVEAAGDDAGQFQVGDLVFSHRDQVGLAEEDVGSLVDRVGIHAGVDPLRAGGLDLFLHGGIPVQFGIGHQGQERQQQLVQFRDMAVGEDVGVAGVRVEAGSKVVDGQLVDILGDVLERVTVGEHLVVGDDDIDGDAEVLQADPVLERAEQVADVQGTGRAVSGQDAEFFRCSCKLQFQGGAARHGCLVGAVIEFLFTFHGIDLPCPSNLP